MPTSPDELRRLAQYGTARQAEVLRAVADHGTKEAAAQALDINVRSVFHKISAVQEKAARHGDAPEYDLNHPVAPGFKPRGYSTLYDADGNKILQWAKTTADDRAQEEMAREAVAALCEDVPRVQPTDAPKVVNDDLMAVIPVSDSHVGMYAFAEEVGANYNTKIATDDLCTAVDYLVRQAPRSKRCLILQCGDFFHADNFQGLTERGGHALDIDTRMSLVIRRGMHALRQCVQTALEHHETVELVILSGNHDEVLGCALSVAFSLLYENEPRVIVHDQASERRYVRHGKTLIGATHGHKTRDQDLPAIMATERPQEWGETRHRYFFRGHHHHDRRIEYNGCIVEQVRTLAPGDSFAVGHGYISGRDMKCIIMHREHGEIARSTCALGMLRSEG